MFDDQAHVKSLIFLEGAGTLAKVLEDKFGKDGFAFIVDKGSGQYGSVFAVLGIAKKWHYDAKVEIAASGGHCSVPPPLTVSFSHFHVVLLINNLLVMVEHRHQCIGHRLLLE